MASIHEHELTVHAISAALSVFPKVQDDMLHLFSFNQITSMSAGLFKSVK